MAPTARKAFEVSFKENYAILSMKNGENRFNASFYEGIHSALDEIERNKDVQFMITTGDEKFYSNGLDLAFLSKCSPEEGMKNLNEFPSLVLRLLTFPIPTIAALNGHTFAGGAILALAHDYRVMRTKRGWFCLNEVKLGLQFGEANISLIRAKITDPKALSDAMVMGKQFVAEEALSGGIVQKICPIKELLGTAVQLGQTAVGQHEFNRDFFREFKSNLYSEVVDAFKRQVVNGKKNYRMLSMFVSSKL